MTEHKEPIKGIVTNCMLLAIRISPTDTCDVAAAIKATTIVYVDPDFENDDYYRVIVPLLSHGRLRKDRLSFKRQHHGYCQKRYITLLRDDEDVIKHG